MLITMTILKPLPNNKSLDQSKFKVVAAQKSEFCFGSVENIVAK